MTRGNLQPLPRVPLQAAAQLWSVAGQAAVGQAGAEAHSGQAAAAKARKQRRARQLEEVGDL